MARGDQWGPIRRVEEDPTNVTTTLGHVGDDNSLPIDNLWSS
jgi:hypothetical protein